MNVYKMIDEMGNRQGYLNYLRTAWNVPANLVEWKGEKLYLWGAGRLGRFALKEFEKNGLQIGGVVTSANDQVGAPFESTHFVSLDEIEKEAKIIVCSNSYPDIFHTIKKYGYQSYVYYEILPCLYHELEFFNKTIYDKIGEIIVEEKGEIEEVTKLLSHDDVSMEVFDNILMYRLTFDNRWIDSAFLRSVDRGSEYFDREIVKFGEKEVFLDCGGFMGENSEEFIQKCHNDYGEVVIFEPNPDLMLMAKNNLRNYKNVRLYTKAVGEKDGTAFFDPQGASGAVCDNGNLKVEIASIDTLQPEVCPTYIKMDIEGAEIGALKGSISTIKKYRPKMAICIYHRASDWYEIIKFINGLNLGYKFYVRHYSRIAASSILYCIPEG